MSRVVKCRGLSLHADGGFSENRGRVVFVVSHSFILWHALSQTNEAHALNTNLDT